MIIVTLSEFFSVLMPTFCSYCQEKLEKAIAKLKANDAYFDNFIDRMHRWLLEVAPVAIELFKKMDFDGEGAVTTDEFKSGESGIP